LSASVWTENIQRGQRLANDLVCGNLMINDCIVSFGMAEISWSGVKQSGIGWVHGEKGLDEMVNIQYITIDKQSRKRQTLHPHNHDVAVQRIAVSYHLVHAT